MKRNPLLLLLTLIMGLGTLTANAFPVTIKVAPGSAAHITQESTGQVLQKLESGATTTYEIPSNGTVILISPDEGHAIVKMTLDGSIVSNTKKTNGATQLYGTEGVDFHCWYQRLDKQGGSVIEVTTQPVSQLPTYSFTVNIDNPAAVEAKCNFIGEVLTLTKGLNTFNYHPTFTNSLIVKSIDGTPINKVTLNGTDVTKVWGSYTVNLSDGAKIDIEAAMPDAEYTYNLTYGDEAGYWRRITADGVDITPVNNTITVKAGALVELYTNGPTWLTKLIRTPDGNEHKASYVGATTFQDDGVYPYSFYATMDGGDIYVDAHVIKNYNVTFNVTGADLVDVINGKWSDTDESKLLQIKEGENHFVINELTTELAIRLKNGVEGYLAPVTYIPTTGAEPVDAYYLASADCYTIYSGAYGEGAVFNINATTDAKSYSVTVDVDHPEDVALYTFYDPYGFEGRVPVTAKLKSGKNTLSFTENLTTLHIVPATLDSYITEVTYTIDGQAHSAAYSTEHNYYTIENMAQGGEITIRANHQEYANRCVFYIDNASVGGTSITTATGRSIPLTDGYNTVNFDDVDNGTTGMYIKMYTAPAYFNLFRNGTLLDENGPDKATITLNDGDVIFLLTATESPAMRNVRFKTVNDKTGSDDETLVPTFTDMVRDLYTTVDNSDLADIIKVLPGTRFDFGVAAPEGLTITKVTYNDSDLTPDEDGRYTISANGTTNRVEIHYTPAEIDSIDAIDAATGAAAEYFDLQGRRVANPSTGIYIRKNADKVEKIIIR